MSNMFPMLQRSAIVVAVKEPFIEWVFNIRQAHYGCSQINLGDIRKRAAGRKNIYLLPPGRVLNPDAFIKENFPAFFENELSDWCLRTELWPADRSWDVFCKWLGCEFQPLVYDAAPEIGIEYEEGL